MDMLSKTNRTGAQYGFSTKLKRHGATVAEHDNFDRRDFLRILADCQQNLGIEGRSDSPIREFNEEGEEIKQSNTKFDWQTLSCPKCDCQAKNTQKLMDHLVESHGKPQDKKWYKQFNVAGKEIKKMLDQAVEAQASCSYVKKKFENSNDLLICPTDSPLLPFLMMRHLQVYLKELPSTVSEGISVKLQCADTSYNVIFALQKVERRRRRVMNAFTNKQRDKRLKELEAKCARSWVAQNDVVFKQTRTPEENRALAQALKLPLTCSHEDIVKKVAEMKARHEEINNIYNNTVKANGQIMSAEEKKLISSLTSNFMVPVSGKRKTTFKNPSELIKKKAKEAVMVQRAMKA